MSRGGSNRPTRCLSVHSYRCPGWEGWAKSLSRLAGSWAAGIDEPWPKGGSDWAAAWAGLRSRATCHLSATTVEVVICPAWSNKARGESSSGVYSLSRRPGGLLTRHIGPATGFPIFALDSDVTPVACLGEPACLMRFVLQQRCFSMDMLLVQEVGSTEEGTAACCKAQRCCSLRSSISPLVECAAATNDGTLAR